MMSNHTDDFRRNSSTPPAIAGVDTSCPFFIGVAGGTASGKVVKADQEAILVTIAICHPTRRACARR